MVSWADPLKQVSDEPLPVRTFVFLDDKGASHHVEATNITDAWVSLSFLEEAEVEELIERGWRVKFR